MSGLEAVAHALAGSTGGIVAMTLLYPLENIRTRLQVQVKRKEAVAARPHDSAAAAASPAAAAASSTAAAVPAVPLLHTHDNAASSPVPEECISPETPHKQQPHAAAAVAAPLRSVHTETHEALNTPRRTLPPPLAAQPLTCLACLSERAPAAASSTSSSVASSSSSSPSGTFVLPSGEIVYDFRGSVDCVQQVVAREGLGKLYSGLSSAVVGVGVSSAVYFFFYYSLKTLVLAHTGARSKSLGPLHNLGVASVAGVLNVLITLPIWLVNTRMTVGAPAHAPPYKGLLDAIRRIHAEEGFTGFYRGLLPSLILVSNPAIQFVVYEQCIRILSKQAAKQAAASALVVAAGSAAAVAGAAASPAVVRLSSVQYFVLGAFAKAVATVATYPYQVVKSRQQASKGAQTTLQLVAQIWREEGPPAFFNGINAKMSQTVLNSAFMFAVYERLVTLILKFLRWVNTEYSHLPKPAP